MKRTISKNIHTSWNKKYTPKEAEERFDKCFKQLEDLMGLNCEVTEMMEICSKRTYDEYILCMRLIESAKYYLKFFNRNKIDFLYLLYSEDLNLCKIGITGDLEQRLKGIKNEMGLNHLDVLYVVPKHAFLEKSLHDKFSHLNVPVKRKYNNREWFKLTDEIINEYKSLINE